MEVDYLRDPDGRVAALLDRLARLVRRLEGCPRPVVSESLRRQERRVRDSRRLAGVSKTLLDLCRFRPPDGWGQAPEVREALFRARGEMWPPVPGDERLPYRRVDEALGLAEEDVDRLLYADDPGAVLLERAPRVSGAELLDRYNLELARAVLLDAERVEITARGGWRGIFRAVKLAGLMYEVERVSARRYRVTLTGPAADFVTHPRRYGARFARVLPAVVRAPGWRVEARVLTHGKPHRYVLDASRLPAPPKRRRSRRYDSTWERSLADQFAARVGPKRGGWTLIREETPVALGESVFLPDFTLRHRDGREALVEVVGFWTPEYLDAKVAKVREADLEHLILVVSGTLAAGELTEASRGPVLWFKGKPKIAEVLEAAEKVARRDPGIRSGGS